MAVARLHKYSLWTYSGLIACAWCVTHPNYRREGHYGGNLLNRTTNAVCHVGLMYRVG